MVPRDQTERWKANVIEPSQATNNSGVLLGTARAHGRVSAEERDRGSGRGPPERAGVDQTVPQLRGARRPRRAPHPGGSTARLSSPASAAPGRVPVAPVGPVSTRARRAHGHPRRARSRRAPRARGRSGRGWNRAQALLTVRLFGAGADPCPARTRGGGRNVLRWAIPAASPQAWWSRVANGKERQRPHVARPHDPLDVSAPSTETVTPP